MNYNFLTWCSYLTLFLTVIIRLFNPRVPPIQLPTSPSEPLHTARSTSPEDSHSIAKRLVPKHSPSFDLTLARISICFELLGYVGMTFSMSTLSWTIPSLFRAFGGGFAPCVQSIALVLYERGPHQGVEVGKLFGGLSVVQALR